MSSHREAPEISKDPVADNTDVYAFVSPDAPDSVTIVANYIPLEAPAGGPIFDLLVLRPFQNLHAKFGQNILNHPAPGVNSLRSFNVHTIALQVPIAELTRGHDRPSNPASSDAVVGVWASASRRQVTIR